MPDEFYVGLERIQQDKNTRLLMLLKPVLAKLPGIIMKYDDPFLPFGKEIIAATRDYVCGYVFDLAAYLAIGAAGAVALERTIAYARGEAVTILHGPFASVDYAALADETALGVDALTVTASMPLEAFTTRSDRGVFVVQPGAIQKNAGHPVYWVDAARWTYPRPDGVPAEMTLVGEDVLYAAQTPDYVQKVRAALEGVYRAEQKAQQ